MITTKRFDTAIIPLGSLEQHGHHLPFSTDTVIVEHISKIISQKIDVFLVPPIYFGVSFEHEPFFNISINHDILLNFISDICVSLFKQGINRIFVINGHHGNIGILQYIGQHLSIQRAIKEKFFYFINYWELLDSTFDHAGEVETSLMLSIRPDLVKMDLLKKGLELSDNKNIKLIKNGMNMSINNPGGFIKFTKNGIWGNPFNSSSDDGKNLTLNIIEKIISLISDTNYK
ncbi:MAG TPA: creatininase family protein [Candidatus Nitrosocosmicus sp.]